MNNSSSGFMEVSELSRRLLPPKHTMLIKGGSFMILDHEIKTSNSRPTDRPRCGSFVEIAFGDDRKNFSGVKRLEVSRVDDDGEGVTVKQTQVWHAIRRSMER